MSTITIEGNLVEELRLNFTKTGKAVANLVVLENRRVKDAQGEWSDATPTRYDVVVWGQMAENTAESLTSGARVVITGSLFTEKWSTEAGETRYSTKMHADAIGASLRYAVAQLSKPAGRQSPEPTDEG